MTTLLLATRKSPLALWQANQVAARLRACHPGLDVDLYQVQTTGDRDQRKDLNEISATGVFTKEVDNAVLNGATHVAVHSLKDQLTTLPEGLDLEVVLPRGPLEDALVSPIPFADLKSGARIGTGSLRRQAQLLRIRPDLLVVPVRGNVDTRIRQVDSGTVDAVVLACAGLRRLGLDERIRTVFPLADVLPAPGQGIVGVTFREDDDRTRGLLAACTDAAAASASTTERAFLRALHGGCNVPAGAWARVEDDQVLLTARVLSLDGMTCLETEERGSLGQEDELGLRAAETLLTQGAAPLIEAQR